MKKIQGQGYVGLAHGEDIPREHSDDTLEGEEEGNGRAIVEDDKEGDVSFNSVHFILF